jgi:DNA-directed RNA polymerase specialized sigma24 family protein
MREFVLLIDKIKEDNNNFILLIEKMEPLIKKYMHLLYKDNPEDIRAELLLALWEAVLNIQYYENDGQVVKFLCTALRNRYLELYKKSRRIHDNELIGEENFEMYEKSKEYETDDIIFKEDLMSKINTYQGIKKEILYKIFIENLSDKEISKQLNLSRQYINRVRRIFGKTILSELMGNIHL